LNAIGLGSARQLSIAALIKFKQRTTTSDETRVIEKLIKSDVVFKEEEG